MIIICAGWPVLTGVQGKRVTRHCICFTRPLTSTLISLRLMPWQLGVTFGANRMDGWVILRTSLLKAYDSPGGLQKSALMTQLHSQGAAFALAYIAGDLDDGAALIDR